ncbi:LLM class F420-dependent oxidoreductase [Tomitella fengzijianii]|uniref:LLM class F420-dependent oxidoreductase n=1 Tax=Tomitella fengzijianii TaxID=2597660 RepID=A0A516X6B5_9ACTN|nr:LLM class F420-dependent oxidoreductase [Tomitella fengzijianii]QDQ98606.1 LLM class F420-dependent oxidoreductase [Tomitella fengzijianii]
MKIGIFSPVVVHHPASASAWEAEAGIAELADIASAADELGFNHLTCSEHVAIPTDVAAERGGTYWDPLATFGFLAARTRRIRFATQVLVLGYHHPLDIAKRYGTLDTVSGGRLILGVGVGSLQEEFELIGAQFDGRGAVADDAMRALRASLGRTAPEYSGTHFSYRDWFVKPAAVQEHVPMWVGGRTPRSLRRAAELGDGWVPFGLPHSRLSELLARHELPDGFDVVLSAEHAVDPADEPDRCRAALESTRDAGATVATVTIAARSAAHYLEQLAALAERAREVGAQLG